MQGHTEFSIPAVVAAGDQRAAKAIYGQSKVYLEVGGRSLVAHVVATLQRVPEVSEVWVVGNPERLEFVFGKEDMKGVLSKPLHIVPQFRNLYENLWETYRRLLPGAGPDGRDPESEADRDQKVLYLSGDLPFTTPQELSEFTRRGAELDCDYALGLVTESSMEPFYPTPDGKPGIRMAYFNLMEGRYRQSNLHLVRPGRLGNRHYVEEMYEHRYQKEFGNILSLAWTILSSESGGARIFFYFGILQLASIANRAGWQRLSNWLRRFVPITRVESACSSLLRTRLRIVSTEVGGSALDIDNEEDFEVAKERFDDWTAQQRALAERLHGPLPLAPVASSSGGPSREGSA